MNIQKIFEYLVAHPKTAIGIGILVLYAGLAFIVSLHKRWNFYGWYFVAILVPLIGAVVAPSPKNLYCYTFLLGMATAFAEIISKFRDEPIKALGMTHALFYHLLNGAIAAFALKVLFLFGTPITTPADEFKAVLAAGLGSMLIMRSKLFNIKVGGEDVSFGPEQIIKIFFRFMEAAIDRMRAQSRIEFVKNILGNINPEKVYSYSETMLLASQAMEEAARKSCLEGIKSLRAGDFKDELPKLKSYRLGFLLLDNMGEDFVIKLFQNVPPDYLLEAPIQEKKEVSLVDKLGTLPLFPSADIKEQVIPYFAYGTNMRSQIFRARLGARWREMDETKFREVTSPQKCVLEGYKVVFDGCREAREESLELGVEHVVMGLATIIQGNPEDKVEGVLYQLSKEVIEFLDMTEPGYYRAKVTVKVDNKPVQAEAYMAERKQEGQTPDQKYLQIIFDGATEFGLSADYQAKLKQIAQEVEAALATA